MKAKEVKVVIDEAQPESTEIIEKFVSKFKSEFPDMSLERSDERFTSKMAFQTMIDSGLKKKQRQTKALVDEIAATTISKRKKLEASTALICVTPN